MENRFVVEQKPFLALLASMQPICTKRTPIEATSSILFHVGHKELILKSTDLEISLQASYLLKDSAVQEPFSFLVSGKRVFELVKELDDDISFVVDNNQLILQAGGVHLALNVKDAQEFPPFPERIENLMQFDATFLLTMLNKVSFLIPQNNANPALNGLFLEISAADMRMTATDGHCLAQASSSAYHLEQPQKWLLPRRAIFEVKKIIEGLQDQTIFLGTCANQLVFSGSSFNFFTKLLVDQFPHYEPILEREGFLGATIDKNKLIKTLRRSACLLSGQFLASKFDFSPDQVNVSLHNKEVGKLEEQIPLHAYQGERLDIRFYAPYVLSGLQVFSEDMVQFFLKNQARPIVFESDTDAMKFVYLVMPVSASNQI